MNRFVALVVAACCVFLAIGRCTRAIEPEKPEAALHRYVLPKASLPEGCYTDRRLLTSDWTILQEAADEFFGDKVNPNSLRAFLNDIYRERDELGVTAMLFETMKSAEHAKKVLTARYAKETSRVYIVRDGSAVVFVWRDAVTSDESFKVFKDFIEKQVDRMQP